MKRIKNLLLIDDSKIDCFMNEQLIAKYDNDLMINIYYSPKNALKFLASLPEGLQEEGIYKPDFILLDLHIPRMNGFQFLDALEELNYLKKNPIPVYVLSSSSCQNDINSVLGKKYCSGYINKPLDEHKLDHIIGTQLKILNTSKENLFSSSKYVLL